MSGTELAPGLRLASIGTPEAGDARAEVVIACHNTSRPIGRAAASILDGNPEAALTIVCHNLPAQQVAAALPEHLAGRPRYLEYTDPRRSPAGPFNAGLTQARTPWVSIMGSDDRLAPGAVASWLRLAQATGAQMVIARLALGEPGRHVPTPPVRASRVAATAALGHLLARADGAAQPGGQGALRSVLARAALCRLEDDRLAYRSAPLGLMSTEFLRREGLSLVPGLPVGEDQALAVRLYARARTVYDAAGPCYLIGEDAADRVTTTARPIAEELAFLPSLTGEAMRGLSLRQRRAVAIKTARIHIFGAIHYRPEAAQWNAQEREDLAAACHLLTTSAPGWEGNLSLAEARLLAACRDPQVSAAELIEASRERRRHGHPRTLLTAVPAALFSSQSPARLMAASVLAAALPGRSDSWHTQEAT